MNMYKGLRISSRLYNEKGLLVKISLFRNVAMFKTTHLVSLFSSSSIPELYDDLPWPWKRGNDVTFSFKNFVIKIFLAWCPKIMVLELNSKQIRQH